MQEALVPPTLGVTQPAISHHLKSLGMIQKQGNCVPYELTPRNVERRFFTCEMLLASINERVFCIVYSLMMKNGFTTITQRRKNLGDHPAMPQNFGDHLAMFQHQQPSGTFMEKSSFVASAWCRIL